MENASKALIMAGSILLAIIIITLLIKNWSGIKAFQKSQLSENEREQIVFFNQQYTQYANQYVYGSEVFTLLNKYKSDPDSYAEVKVTLLSGGTDMTNTYRNQYTYDNANRTYINNTTYFKCTNIGYDGNGKVSSITFVEVQPKKED